MKDEFIQACELNSDEFTAVCKALRLPRRVDRKRITVETVARLLSYIDNIIEYYLQLKDDDNSIRFPIIYIPCAEAWAEDICIEYVAYKLEAKFDANRRNQIQNQGINTTGIPVEDQDREVKKEQEWRGKTRSIIKTFKKFNSNVRNLIICGKSQYNNIYGKSQYNNIYGKSQYNNIYGKSHCDNIDEKSQCNKIYGNENLVRFLGKSPTTSIESIDVIGIEEKYRDYQDISNIFCFYSRNRECDSFEVNSLCNWKNLKNCFVIEFSSDPYYLDSIIKDGRKLCEKFVHEYFLSRDDTQNRYQDFVSLTLEEAHYLFHREYKNAHTLVPISNELQDEKEYIIDLYQGSGDWRFSIKDRNVLSLCIASNIKEAYLTYLKKDRPSLFENQWYRSVLDLVLDKIPEGIVDKIFSYIEIEDKKAAIVINDAPDAIKTALKTALKKFFKGNNITIKLYSYQDLKEKKIKEKKIIVLRFCPHNLSSIEFGHKKPNSFDEFDLKEGQQILDIINEWAFIDFSRYQYDYDIRLCAVSNSRFRKDQLGGYLAIPNKPDMNYISHYTEADDDESERRSNEIKTVQITFEDGSSQRLPESETVIYFYQDQTDIKSIRDLKEENLFDKITAIQPISELADSTIDIFFKGKTTEINQLEEQLRDNYINSGIMPKEQDRSIPIWKFLLEKKVRDFCMSKGIIQVSQDEPLWQLLRTKLDNEHIATLYKEMNVRVQLPTVIRDWCDLTDEKPIAPLGTHDQENMITRFLNTNPGLTSLYRKKQRIKKNDTRMRNKVTEGFLGRILFNDITNELAEELLRDTQYTENLAIETSEDIVALKQIAIENLELKTIKFSKYESH